MKVRFKSNETYWFAWYTPEIVSTGNTVETIFFDSRGFDRVEFSNCTIMFKELDNPAEEQIRELADEYNISEVEFKNCYFVLKNKGVNFKC